VTAPAFWELDDVMAPDGACVDCATHTVTVYDQGAIKEVTVVDAGADLPPVLALALDEIAGIIDTP
jgi:hypothetical protein